MKLSYSGVAAAIGAVMSTAAMAAPIPVATWNFNNNFHPEEIGAPDMTPIDPLGLNGFMTDTVFGVSETVYRFDGTQLPPTNQAGLSVSTIGLLDMDDSCSIEMLFMFEANQASWELIAGISNRTSDNAFYVEPDDHLQIYPTGNGINIFTFGEYHRVTLTNDRAGHVTAYMEGVFEFDLITSVMDFSSYAVSNPARLIHFFADNVISGGQSEFADGRIAMIRLYDDELTDDEVADLENTVPAPGAMFLVGLGLLGLGVLRRRSRSHFKF